MQITVYNLQRVKLLWITGRFQITSSTFQNAKAELQAVIPYFVSLGLPLLPAGVIDVAT